MPWPPHTLEQFGTVARGDVDESEYYGPYNGLLGELFPGRSHFMVVPQYKRPRFPQFVDFTTIFIVQHNKHPVFFIEIKPSSHVDTIANRAAADDQMRERFESFAEQVSIDTLYGISALGSRVCVYSYDRATRRIVPAAIEKDASRVNDRAPAKWWGLDILEDDGEAHLRQVTTHVHQMCSTLQTHGQD
ncbi:uncharacterized protein EI90DRAFT_3137008 [Cantharellus anzutake]|uniref:uncharacterized protein n=1 Tax=Cantharellus anzutake TaxID=1750568 RepID=UPI001902EEE9|nr:uncharacterized protein EI90DRAFT_3137008 [Cantharellus anzutake]KAF8312893.1 hypothetical protein EI90DRAFT_3137008 [Cantharellus anzutake]